MNAIAGHKGLAFTSARPGCTQLINFFRIGDDYVFADLPGYGYAKVPKDIKREWQGLIEQYLTGRRQLKLCVLLLDSRRGWMEKDLELKQWLEYQDRPYIVVATKIDKLSKPKERNGMDEIRKLADVQPIAFSAVTSRGVREIWQAISKTRTAQ